MGIYKLTVEADADVLRVYKDGEKMFGASQAEKYALGMSKHEGRRLKEIAALFSVSESTIKRVKV